MIILSIATQITALTTDKTNIRNAILAKSGTCAAENGFDDFATDIATIPSGSSMELIKSYTLTESWQNDSVGNTESIYNAILNNVDKTNGDIFICIVRNNTYQGDYSGNYITYPHRYEPNIGIACRRNWTELKTIGPAFSFWISAGATIDVYKINLRMYENEIL